jgi:hypothetical protein
MVHVIQDILRLFLDIRLVIRSLCFSSVVFRSSWLDCVRSCHELFITKCKELVRSCPELGRSCHDLVRSGQDRHEYLMNSDH